jgi:hypothetical protein
MKIQLEVLPIQDTANEKCAKVKGSIPKKNDTSLFGARFRAISLGHLISSAAGLNHLPSEQTISGICDPVLGRNESERPTGSAEHELVSWRDILAILERMRSKTKMSTPL